MCDWWFFSWETLVFSLVWVAKATELNRHTTRFWKCVEVLRASSFFPIRRRMKKKIYIYKLIPLVPLVFTGSRTRRTGQFLATAFGALRCRCGSATTEKRWWPSAPSRSLRSYPVSRWDMLLPLGSLTLDSFSCGFLLVGRCWWSSPVSRWDMLRPLRSHALLFLLRLFAGGSMLMFAREYHRVRLGCL